MAALKDGENRGSASLLFFFLFLMATYVLRGRVIHGVLKLEEAIKLMKADPMVREVLGEHTFHQYVAGKKAEWDLYRTRVSQWEVEKYLVIY